jgi:hypothetical protein
MKSNLDVSLSVSLILGWVASHASIAGEVLEPGTGRLSCVNAETLVQLSPHALPYVLSGDEDGKRHLVGHADRSGLVALDDSIEQYLPPLQARAGDPPMTIRRLYNHMSDLDGHWGDDMNDMEERVVSLLPMLPRQRTFERWPVIRPGTKGRASISATTIPTCTWGRLPKRKTPAPKILNRIRDPIPAEIPRA